MKEHGNSQPRIVLNPFLDSIRELSHLAGAAVLAESRHLSQTILHQDSRALGEEIALLIDKHRLRIGVKLAVLPSAFELRDFLFQENEKKGPAHALPTGGGGFE